MENILNKLTLPDNVSISEGTNEIREALKNPEAIQSLCTVIGSSQNPQIRQLAAIVLRKKLSKHRFWLKLPIETRQYVKQGLMQALINDQEKFVKTSIGQVIAILTRHEVPENGWPEVMQFIQQMTLSEDINEKELGFFTLEILTDMAMDQFLAHAHSFASLFSNTLHSLQDPGSKLAYLVLLCMVNFVPAIEGDQFMVNAYHSMVPQVMIVVKVMARKRPDDTVEALCLIDELADNALTVVVPHLKLIVETCLELSLDKSCGTDLQIKALNIVGLLVQTKKKQVVRLKLVEPMLEVLFRLMCSTPEDEGTEEYFPDMDEASTAATVANQTLDVLALHLPPEKLIPPLMERFVVPNLQHNDVHVRKACYLAMAVVAEGCSEYIRHRHIETLISYVMNGLKDPALPVNNAALFAIGQFSEHLQPNVSLHASQLVPFLLEHLKNISATPAEDVSSKEEKIFYALETFCENLNEALLPFLPTLMQYLVPLLSPPHPVRLRELAISCVGSCGTAAKDAMMPYFPQVMASLKLYLTENQDKDTMCLQVQSVDTLGILARTIGNDNFLPIAKETMELGIHLMKTTDDPDLRKSAYGLFASVASVLKQDMAVFLPTIMEAIITSVKSDSGVVVHLKDESNPSVGIFEDISDNEEEEEDLGNTSDVSSDHEDNDGLTVENAYLEEKEEAVIAVRDLAQNCMEAFLPFVETSFQEVFKLVNYPHDDIKSAALCTLSQLCVNINKLNTPDAKQALLKALDMLVPKCAEMIRTDCERDVVVVGLETYNELLKEVGAPVLAGEGHADAIINCVKDILGRRTECQDKGEGEEEDEEAEGDEMLIESAGEIIPLLGKVMPAQEFAQHFTQFLPMLIDLTKKKASDSQRSFGVGMIAECMSVAGPCLPAYAQQFLGLLATLIKDQNDEVRNNAVFALGELVYHGREAIFPFYSEILNLLANAVSVESSSGVLDNICGALARLILTNTSGVPLEQVIPVFIKYLPLREDFAENKWVYQSVSLLYQLKCEPLVQNLNHVIKACASALHENQIEAENREILLVLLRNIHRDFPAECSKAAGELPELTALTLQQACIS